MTTPPLPAAESRPWWTRRSGIALVFVVGSVLGFMLNVFVPVVSQQRISKQQRRLDRRIADSTRQVEDLSRKLELSRLLFDHYFGKSAIEQKAVIGYLQIAFPRDLGDKRLLAVLGSVDKPEVAKVITRIAASVKRVPTSRLARASKHEAEGFKALIAKDLPRARAEFLAAYGAYPTYHNVDEISHRVLTERLAATFARSPTPQQDATIARVVRQILSTYSWGIPANLRGGLESLT
jgi:hypothetical protein